MEEFSHRYIAGAVKSLAWYDAPISDDPLFPSLAKRLLTASAIAVRPMPLRVWAHPKGHKTLLHYDGNSLSSFNLQLRGSKRWLLISPDTPLPMPPLQFVCLTGPDYFPPPGNTTIASSKRNRVRCCSCPAIASAGRAGDRSQRALFRKRFPTNKAVE